MVQLAADSTSEDKLMLGLGHRRERILLGANVFNNLRNSGKLVQHLACVDTVL